MKRTFAKVAILLMAAMFAFASCKGPRECWGVTSDAESPETELPASC